jgi:hypothetical protein
MMATRKANTKGKIATLKQCAAIRFEAEEIPPEAMPDKETWAVVLFHVRAGFMLLQHDSRALGRKLIKMNELDTEKEDLLEKYLDDMRWAVQYLKDITDAMEKVEARCMCALSRHVVESDRAANKAGAA